MTDAQKRMIAFAAQNAGWHTYSKDAVTVEVLCANVNLGYLRINRHGQFKATKKGRKYWRTTLNSREWIFVPE